MTTPQAPDAGLRKALEPFAEIVPHLEGLADDHPVSLDASWEIAFGSDGVLWDLTVGDFRRAFTAREALSAVPTVDVGGEGNGSSVAGLPSSQEAFDPLDLAKLEEVARAAMAWSHREVSDNRTPAGRFHNTLDPPTVLRLIAMARGKS